MMNRIQMTKKDYDALEEKLQNPKKKVICPR